jgi:hypothetical protein
MQIFDVLLLDLLCVKLVIFTDVTAEIVCENAVTAGDNHLTDYIFVVIWRHYAVNSVFRI